jgi:hypothetical protein
MVIIGSEEKTEITEKTEKGKSIKLSAFAVISVFYALSPGRFKSSRLLQKSNKPVPIFGTAFSRRPYEWHMTLR